MDSIIKTVIITYPNNRTTEHPLDYIQRTVSWRFSVFPRLSQSTIIMQAANGVIAAFHTSGETNCAE